MWMWLVALAAASTGPWVPGTGVANVYVGLDGDQFTELVTPIDGERERLAVGEGVSTLTASASITYGVAPRLEVEFRAPFVASHANREDAGECFALGLEACEPTTTLGVLEASVKGLVFDEVVGSPLSVSVGGVVRYGGFTAPYRQRLTGAGEGTTDFGPRLSLGRSGGLGASGGYWSTSLDLLYLHRIPNTQRFPNQQGSRSVPGDDISAIAEAFFSPKGTVALGPAASFQHRLSGLNFVDVDITDPDRIGALRTTLLSAGLKALVRDRRNNVFVLSAWRTAYAVNNPADQVIVSIGVGLNDVFANRRRSD